MVHQPLPKLLALLPKPLNLFSLQWSRLLTRSILLEKQLLLRRRLLRRLLRLLKQFFQRLLLPLLLALVLSEAQRELSGVDSGMKHLLVGAWLVSQPEMSKASPSDSVGISEQSANSLVMLVAHLTGAIMVEASLARKWLDNRLAHSRDLHLMSEEGLVLSDCLVELPTLDRLLLEVLEVAHSSVLRWLDKLLVDYRAQHTDSVADLDNLAAQ